MKKAACITLCGINQDILEGLYRNNLNEIEFPKFEGINANKVIFNEVYSTSTNSDIYTIHSKSGSQQIIATDTCASNDADRVVMCWWCPMQFKIADNCGIFIDSKQTNGFFKIVRTGFTCCFECSLAYVINKTSMRNYPPQYINSEKYHHTFHRMNNPGAPPLLPSDDPELLYEKGGSLTRNQWSKGNSRFISTSNIIITDAKSTYMKTKIV